MRYSLEQLVMFELTAKAGSFSAAARQANKTQSAVSTSIANLEIDLGVTLFERSARNLTLTASGRKLLEETRVILERCLELEQRAQSIGSGNENMVKMAIGIPYAAVSPALKLFTEQFPHVDMSIKEPFLGDVAAMVSSGAVDLGLAFSQPVDVNECKFTQLGKLIMVHVISADHPLAKKIPVSFQDLHAWRHIVMTTHDNKLSTIEYLKSPQLWLAESYNAITEAALSGLGWATLPKMMVQKELNKGTLVELKQQEYPYTEWLVGVDLLWSAKHPLGPVANWLKHTLIEHKVFQVDSVGQRTTL